MWLTVTEFDYVRGRASFLRPRGVKVDLLTENRKPILYGENKEARSIKGIERFSKLGREFFKQVYEIVSSIILRCGSMSWGFRKPFSLPDEL